MTFLFQKENNLYISHKLRRCYFTVLLTVIVAASLQAASNNVVEYKIYRMCLVFRYCNMGKPLLLLCLLSLGCVHTVTGTV